MSGLYIHIPFCRKKCTYCDFHFTTTFEKYRERMVNAIVHELILRKEEMKEEQIETVYFGGGTPSVLNNLELRKILLSVRDNYDLADNVEITFEANPDDIDPESLLQWRKAGVNRLSIGLQSFRQRDLEWMNRSHSAEQSKVAVAMAQKAGYENITIDLIYGLPEMSLGEWEDQIDQALELNVQHISAYCLTVEPNTALDHLTTTGKITTPEDNVQSEEFLMIRDKLLRVGFEQYEVSNFAKPGFQSRHNSAYWKNKKYLGVGPSAHSYDGSKRRWNVSNNQRYMRQVEGGDEFFEFEILSSEERFNELLLTGLRTIYGVTIEDLEETGIDLSQFKLEIENLKMKNWLIESNGKYVLTPEGLLFADHIASSLFEI